MVDAENVQQLRAWLMAEQEAINEQRKDLLVQLRLGDWASPIDGCML